MKLRDISYDTGEPEQEAGKARYARLGPVTLELPMPPSVNSIWRSRRGANGKPTYYLDAKYKAWKAECDGIIMATRPRPKMPGHFALSIILDETKRGRSDADNRAKGVLDILQRAAIIEDDKLADKMTVAWGHAPTGCRIELWPSP